MCKKRNNMNINRSIILEKLKKKKKSEERLWVVKELPVYPLWEYKFVNQVFWALSQ